MPICKILVEAYYKLCCSANSNLLTNERCSIFVTNWLTDKAMVKFLNEGEEAGVFHYPSPASGQPTGLFSCRVKFYWVERTGDDSDTDHFWPHWPRPLSNTGISTDIHCLNTTLDHKYFYWLDISGNCRPNHCKKHYDINRFHTAKNASHFYW